MHGDDPIRTLKPEDQAEPAWLNQPANEDTISALTEAQLLQVLGKIGVIRHGLIRTFDAPMSNAQRRWVRQSLSAAAEAQTLCQAVLDSTRRQTDAR